MFTGLHNPAGLLAALLLVICSVLPSMEVIATDGKGHFVCFVYHRFDDDRYPSTNIPVSDFRAQLAYLKQNNFTVWTMGEAVEALTAGIEIPTRTVVLTIDDGYLSFYENGLPLLREFGYPATVYINTANVGNPDYLDWEQIRKISEQGIEIGNHSHGHGHFLDITDSNERKERFWSDLITSQLVFFDSLGFSPDLYSYPYGEYDEVMAQGLREAGFISAAAQYSGVIYHGTNLFELPRYPMGGPFATLKGFIQKSQMLPIQVISKRPEGIVMTENPPVMEIIFRSDCVNTEHIQCFVNGERNCVTEMQEGPEQVRIRVMSRDLLPGRRSLYTITAPSKNGKGWCWFSHVWVNTEVAEE